MKQLRQEGILLKLASGGSTYSHFLYIMWGYVFTVQKKTKKKTLHRGRHPHEMHCKKYK
jgi:hypothetical protein